MKPEHLDYDAALTEPDADYRQVGDKLFRVTQLASEDPADVRRRDKVEDPSEPGTIYRHQHVSSL